MSHAFFNYELSESDKNRFPVASEHGGWMELECPLVCDGFECVAKVGLLLSGDEIEPETEEDKLLPARWDIRQASAKVGIVVDGLGLSLVAEFEDKYFGVDGPLGLAAYG